MQLEYPLSEYMHENMLLTQEKTAIAYYRIRSETVMLTDFEKKQKRRKSCPCAETVKRQRRL